MRRLVEQGLSIWFKWMGALPKKDIIYFESFHGKQYSDNPKAIYEALKQEYPNQKLVWGVTKGYELPFVEQAIPHIQRFSLRWFFVMPRARAWVMNTRTPLWLSKSKGTQYIQTWHGTPLKKIGVDIQEMNIPDYTQESYALEFKQESARWDCLMSASRYTSEAFRTAFLYEGPLLEVGFPRNDALVNASPESVEAVKERLHLPKDKRLVLYAPTWRETDHKTQAGYEFSVSFPYEAFSKQFGKETILLVRMHYLVADQLTFNNDYIKNVSTGYDMSDLLLVSDVLITDYSSCLIDFSLTNRPMVFYWPDQEAYAKDIRGFYLDFSSRLPGPIAKTADELLNQMEQLIQQPSSSNPKSYELFREQFAGFESGHAAVRVSHYLMTKTKEDTKS